MSRHQIQRLRFETRRRTLPIERIEDLSPRMRRFHFRSAELHDFASGSPDDHLKCVFPDGAGGEVMRDFTARSFDVEAGTLVVDFALHDKGAATEWAANAKVGDTLDIAGPKGSGVVPDDFDWYLLVGDETALPAIGRRIEELRAGVPVLALLIVDGPHEEQQFTTNADATIIWVLRDGQQDDAALLLNALKPRPLPQGEGYAWIAAEIDVARAIRTHMLEDRQHPREWMKAAGYWARGIADGKGKIQD